ncbi:MAG TPA: AMP-binding protein [Candidatus Acidoferrum sp.]|nr:AMP-binding protein [Candidatus Acidoferrum sp.]
MVFRSPWPDIELPSCSICEEILGDAERRGDKPAVIESETERVLTYRQLIDGANRVAAGLSLAGLQPGQPLAVVLPNCIDFALAWLGTLRAGAWVVPINPLYTPPELETQIQDSGARYVVAATECATSLERVVDHVFVTGSNWNEILECSAAPPTVLTSVEDLAAMPYSSGTTGKPKGVMLTHFNILSGLRQARAVGVPRTEDVMVSMAPPYHVTGLVSFLTGLLAVGGTLVLMRRFDSERWLALCERYSATILFGPPPVVVALTKSPLWSKFRLDSVVWMACGTAPLGADLHREFELRTGLVLRQGYGMTEATSATSIDSKDRAVRKFGSCGPLLPSTEARVVEPGSGNDLDAGETGEIWLRGPHIMKGYWKQPEATAQALVGDGWLRTGDIGYLDADGCVFILDRLKEFIKYKGYQVSPAELEDVLQSHPAVLDAGVIGAPDEAAGEIPLAFVVKKAGAALDAGELIQYVAARVAPYKKIRAVEFIDQIPKSPAGKILRRVLKEDLRTRPAH